MITVTDNYTFMQICDKLKDVPDCKLKPLNLYSYMIGGLYNKTTFTFAQVNKGHMESCIVLSIKKDITGKLALCIVFQWIDSHFPKLWLENMKFIEGKATEYKADKITFVTARSEKAIERKLGKFGYRKVYNVIEKDVV